MLLIRTLEQHDFSKKTYATNVGFKRKIRIYLEFAFFYVLFWLFLIWFQDRMPYSDEMFLKFYVFLQGLRGRQFSFSCHWLPVFDFLFKSVRAARMDSLLPESYDIFKSKLNQVKSYLPFKSYICCIGLS